MTTDAEVQRQFAALGVAVPIDKDRTDDVAVWSTNWKSLTAFLACETQWSVAVGMTGLIWMGLNYPGVDIVLKYRSGDAAVFEDLRVMERAALEAFSEATS